MDLIKLVMKIFYKKNSKVINRFLLFIFLIGNLFVALDYYQQGLAVDSYQKHKKVHFDTKHLISKNLKTKCTILSDSKLKAKIQTELTSKDIGFDLVGQDVITINSLIFIRVIFRTFNKSDHSISYTSKGYLVQNSESNACYGLI